MNQHVELLEQAEASVLGGALASEAFAARAVSSLSEEDFRRDAHRRLFRAVGAVARAGNHGTVAVVEWLIDEGGLDEVGGPAAVSQLSSRNLNPATFGERIAKVESASHLRLLREKVLKVAEACTDWQTDDRELTSMAVRALLEAEAGRDAGGVVTVADRREQLGTILKAGTSARSVSTGWRSLDRHYRPAPGRWTLVGGIPGHGKTSLLDALLFNLARQHGWRTLICSPEKQPIELHMAQLVQLAAGRPLLNRGVPAEGADVDAAVAFVDDHFGWLELGEDGRDVGSLLSLSRLEHIRHPFDGLVVDPWNELDHSRDRNLTETEHISQSLSRLRNFARKLDVHVWMVAHPTKLRKREDGTYPVPTPYDVSGSANWRNKADNALAIWRDHGAPGSPSQVYVQKVRFQPDDGKEGMVELRFDTSTGLFSEVSPV
jgi:twinkle protein